MCACVGLVAGTAVAVADLTGPQGDARPHQLPPEADHSKGQSPSIQPEGEGGNEEATGPKGT